MKIWMKKKTKFLKSVTSGNMVYPIILKNQTKRNVVMIIAYNGFLNNSFMPVMKRIDFTR